MPSMAWLWHSPACSKWVRKRSARGVEPWVALCVLGAGGPPQLLVGTRSARADMLALVRGPSGSPSGVVYECVSVCVDVNGFEDACKCENAF